MTHVDLFSGIGGFALAARWAGFHTVCFSEVDPFCCALLGERFPGVPNVGDIRTADWSAYRGATLVTGGFPCQPWSVAGKRRGAEDDRHLWPAMLAAIDAIRPAWVLGENVVGLVSMGLDGMLSDLEGIGYCCRPFVIPAVAVDAPHRRDRVWIIANNAGSRSRMVPSIQREATAYARWSSERVVAHTEEREAAIGVCRWLPEPDVGRVVDGVSARMDEIAGVPIESTQTTTKKRSAGRAHRLKGLGNAIVPQVAAEIMSAIAALAAEGEEGR